MVILSIVVILFRVPSYMEFSMSSMNSGSYQGCLTELTFEVWISFFKIKFRGVVLVAS